MSRRPKDFFANNGDNPLAPVATHPTIILLTPIIIVTVLGILGYFGRGVLLEVEEIGATTSDLRTEQRVMIVEQREITKDVADIALEVNELDNRLDDVEAELVRLGLE